MNTLIEGRSPARTALTVGALGAVFGDIGTSPIYTIQTVFNPEARTLLTPSSTTSTASCR